jgi:hypothetical protein
MATGLWVPEICPGGQHMEHGGRTRISLATSCRLEKFNESDGTTPSFYVHTKNSPAVHVLLFGSHTDKSTVALH